MRLKLVAVSMILFSCSGPAANQKDVAADSQTIYQPGQLIETTEPGKAVVKCTGIGLTMEAAIQNGREACVHWWVLDKLMPNTTDAAGRKRVLSRVLSELDRYIEVPGPAERGARERGLRRRAKLPDNTIQVLMIVELYTSRLLEAVTAITGKAMTVVPARRAVVLVQATPEQKQDADLALARDLIGKYVSEQGYEVQFADAQEGQPGWQARIVFSFDVLHDPEHDSIAYSARLKATDPLNRILAMEVVQSAARYAKRAGQEQAALSEAISNAVFKVLLKLRPHLQ